MPLSPWHSHPSLQPRLCPCISPEPCLTPLAPASPHPLLPTAAAPLQSWNMLTVELWTHARLGLTENDFIVASKIDKLPKDDLLSKKKYRRP